MKRYALHRTTGDEEVVRKYMYRNKNLLFLLQEYEEHQRDDDPLITAYAQISELKTGQVFVCINIKWQRFYCKMRQPLVHHLA